MADTDSPELDLPARFDFTDPQLHGQRMPFEEYATLRRYAPVWWNAKPPGVDGFPDDGFWVVSRHADIRDVSLRPEDFSSNANGAIPRHERPSRRRSSRSPRTS